MEGGHKTQNPPQELAVPKVREICLIPYKFNMNRRRNIVEPRLSRQR